MGQLYDMENDPQEKRNVYTRHPEVVKALTDYLERIKASGRSAPQ